MSEATDDQPTYLPPEADSSDADPMDADTVELAPVVALAGPPAVELAIETDGPMADVRRLFDRINAELRKIYVGQDERVLGTLTALFSQGHVLIESVPGLGKTLFVRALGRVLGCAFGRIQFTADLMPSDITGSPILDLKTQEFRFLPGPVFTQFLLADEINRSPAKTHAALLEIMQEYHVTVERVSPKRSSTASCSKFSSTIRRRRRRPTCSRCTAARSISTPAWPTCKR